MFNKDHIQEVEHVYQYHNVVISFPRMVTHAAYLFRDLQQPKLISEKSHEIHLTT